ncbi:hypothetical protein TARUN_4546 [Trichoderma arundinaceum]|uniref:Uncharacterized protein n=1 Tax=Trichoderma arundinaceum TaxID=490622 RepID=A0A395NPB8_TRIAR|nr:hypothetical protein TARUN_4546 [Trichoderma arundinaceum]
MSAASSNDVSAQTGLIGLINSSNQIITSLARMNELSTTKRCIKPSTFAHLEQFQLLGQQLYNNLRRAELGRIPQSERIVLINVDALLVVLTEAILVVSELGHKVSNILNLSHGLGSSPADMVNRYAGAIREDVSKVVDCKQSIRKFVTILNAEDIYDAYGCHLGMDEVATRILEGNVWLRQKINEMSPDRTVSGAGASNHDISQPESPLPGLTLKDVGRASLVPLPLVRSELRFGKEFYSIEYAGYFDENY